MRRNGPVVRLLAALVLTGLIGGLLVAAFSGATTNTTAPVPTPEATAASSAPVRFSDLPAVTLDELPPEALTTLGLIASGGPFPYDQDDSVFQNREGLLPDQEQGYYREYTVETPGSDDRGARRLVVGALRDVYWTDDHYESFSELVSG